jgi:hypothetical protein
MHLILDRARAGQLREAGHADVVVFVDNLAVGPAVADLDRLRAARDGFWSARGEGCAAGDMRAVLAGSPETLIVWATHRWRERLALWCLLHTAAESGHGGDVRLVEPLEVGDPMRPVGFGSAGEIAAHLGRAQRVTAEMLAEASRLWRAYCSPTPEAVARLSFDRLRCFRRARLAFRSYTMSLPRLRVPDAAQAWKLSPRDEVLLRGYERDRWTTPLAWIRAQGMEGPAGAILGEFGDVQALERWSSFTASARPLLEARDVSIGKSSWTKTEYRLTEDGSRALRGLLDDPRDVPRLEVGGYVAYRDPLWSASWIGDDWAIAPGPSSAT